MLISERLKRLGSGVFARMDQRKRSYAARATAAQLHPLLDLSLGSTDLQPPPEVLAAMAAQLTQPASAGYCLQAGTLPFREAAAAWVQQRFGVQVDPLREVLLLVGSQEGTAHLPLALLNPGDRALLLDPCYPSHRGGVLLAGGEPLLLPLQLEDGWRPCFERLPCSEQQQLKLLMLGYPHNPTATTGNQGWLDEGLALAKREGAVLAHDNPYVDLALEGEAPALLRSSGWRENGIEFFSFSKGWCLGGFRLGFAVGAAALIEALAQVKAVVDFNQSLALQAGAKIALTQLPHWPQQLKPIYKQRRDAMAAALKAGGWIVPPSSMALYLWMPLPPRLLALGSEAACSWLLERSGVALTPGIGFGAGGEGWLRLALVAEIDQLQQAAKRLNAALIEN
ncbi:aminotransferase class I/II-fold pyridoxal phosphate-dependent enzyme [Synechococcus sp. UW140]|uniref:aminotransferase class I/II-fold pyridoxal phosphate-dependent enzyme n=1 Tax=Synechococcus sp. UW140 TaxID=368503 RepID=UPI0025FB0989|nr:aminotransferase class I/II-fold pyridoxal phosphate-dependent enzyme [Synechococcus sp. UW140]MCX5928742.1 aminotransferase class I/II-fold pyridoxal phosphate-dependent enzyme [Synechococcus sp. LacPavin_0920_WC12_MAG_50_7]